MLTWRFLAVLGGAVALSLAACGGNSERSVPASGAGASGSPTSDPGEGGAPDGESGGMSAGGRGGAVTSGGRGGAVTGGGAAGTGGVPPSSGGTGAGANAAEGGSGASAGTGARGGGPPGLSSDPSYCTVGWYDTDPGEGVAQCEPWTVCESGTFIAESGSYKADAVCSPCPSRTFSTSANAFFCPDWKKCSFGEDVVVEPTAMRDRQCMTKSSKHYGTAGPLVVTDQGSYLLTGDDIALVIAGYSLEGEPTENWVVATGLGNETAVDITSIGDDVFVGGWKWIDGPEERTQPGFVSKLGPNGTNAWSKEFSSAREHVSALSLASHEGSLYVVARVTEQTCAVKPDGGNTCDEGAEPPSELVLFVLDAAGATRKKTLEEDTDVERFHVLDVHVTANGHFFVVVRRAEADYDPVVFIEYDAAGNEVAERTFGQNGYSSQALWAADASGLYVLTAVDAATHALNRVSTGGELVFTRSFTHRSLRRIDTLGVAGDELLLLADAVGGPALLRLDASGAVIDEHVLEDTKMPGQFSAVVQGADGTVLVAGVSEAGVFVEPWPERSK